MSLICVIIIGIRIDMVDKRQAETMPMEAKVIKVNQEYITVKSRYQYRIYCNEPYDYVPGMILLIDGDDIQIDEKHIKHHMSYRTYLKSQNIQGMIQANQIKVISKKKSIYILPYDMNHYIDNIARDKINIYLKLFVLGDKSSLDDEIYQQAKDIGISHLFAISGMHVGIILFALNYFLSLFYMKRNTYFICLGILMLLYNIMTGLSVSIMRASLLSFIVIINHHKKNKISSLDGLTLIFLLFIVYQPYMIYSVGFQLSFLISGSIILLGKQKRSGALKQLYVVSFFAIIVSLPIILSMNHQIGLLNIIVGPFFIITVSTLLLPGAFIILIYPQLSNIYKIIAVGFEKMIVFVHQSNIYFQYSINHWIYFVFYWVLIILTLRYKRLNRRIIFIWVCFLFLLLINPTSYISKVIIFDVNQGDAIYIQSQQCRMLIDTGSKDDYHTVLNYFEGENINRLDALIMTHNHSDHIGEADSLIKSLNIENVYVSNNPEIIKGVKAQILYENNHLECGHFDLQVIHADQGDSNENNNSIVFLMRGFDETWLLTGDIEEEVEKDIWNEIPSHIDHLKVAHHGSMTSTSDGFIDKLSIANAYISYGKNNYGIPSSEVIDKLTLNGSQIYSTYEHGSIEVIYIGRYRIYHFEQTHKNILTKRKT